MMSPPEYSSDLTFVHLIRHGKPLSTWGDEGADPDPGLDPEGRDQAEAAADALLSLPQPQRPVGVVSSPLRRCRETAQPLAARLGVELVIEPGVAEIPTPAGLAAAVRPDWLRKAFTGAWTDIPGDRDYAAWAAGVASACARHPGAAVFSHFVAINAAVGVALEDPRVRQFEPGHASITSFTIVNGRLRLERQGVVAATQIL
jgi:broad specificity phosphatase PhoE